LGDANPRLRIAWARKILQQISSQQPLVLSGNMLDSLISTASFLDPERAMPMPAR
jgi:hypothetical protein